MKGRHNVLVFAFQVCLSICKVLNKMQLASQCSQCKGHCAVLVCGFPLSLSVWTSVHCHSAKGFFSRLVHRSLCLLHCFQETCGPHRAQVPVAACIYALGMPSHNYRTRRCAQKPLLLDGLWVWKTTAGNDHPGHPCH